MPVAKLYVGLIALRLAGLALLVVALVVALALPDAASGLARVIGLSGFLHVLAPWLIGYIAGALWARGLGAWRGAEQFSSLDLWGTRCRRGTARSAPLVEASS